MKRNITALRADQRGATAIEYGLIVALVVIVGLGGMSALGVSTTGLWAGVLTKVSAVIS